MEQQPGDSHPWPWHFAKSSSCKVCAENDNEGEKTWWKSSIPRHQKSPQEHPVRSSVDCKALEASFPHKNPCFCFSKNIRSYPIAFGLRIMRYLPKLRAGATGWPPLDEQGGGQDAISMFRAMPMGPDNWSEASLLDVVKYLRGSIHLRLPQDWKDAFPEAI